ncbi:hypothetical protein [Neisseria sp. HMSC075C12]|uniref:hypothetical protein n=1 Tax=Neisseria sp. HMSC075C12 TaxID=1739282 RepID=UPI0024B1C403|nr:hypothetical protein [Neisseria sp. HMSC075C12]
MNLKLLLTAALSTAALTAHAGVQLYGSIKSGIETSQTRFGGQSYSRTAVADQGISACAVRTRLAGERILFGKSNKTHRSAKAAPSAKAGANVETILAVKGKIG